MSPPAPAPSNLNSSPRRKRPKPSSTDGDPLLGEDNDSCITDASITTATNTHESVANMDDIEDNDGFKIVTHRKKRPNGVPILLQPTAGHRLQSANPIILNGIAAKAAGSSNLKHRFTSRGGLLINVETEQQATQLLNCETLGEIPIMTTVPVT